MKKGSGDLLPTPLNDSSGNRRAKLKQE